MARPLPVLKTIVFIGAASFLGLGLLLWNQSRIVTTLSILDPASLVVKTPDEFHLIPVKLTNRGNSELQIVGFNGY